MQNEMMLFILLLQIKKMILGQFWSGIPFLYKLALKNKNFQFKLKFDTQANSVMQNLMVVFKIGHLVPRLSRIYRIHWECSLFVCQTRDTLNGRMWSKNQHFQIKINIYKRSNEEFDGDFNVFLLRPKPKIFFCGGGVHQLHNIKIFSCNLVLELIQIFRIQQCFFAFSVLDWKYYC